MEIWKTDEFVVWEHKLDPLEQEALDQEILSLVQSPKIGMPSSNPDLSQIRLHNYEDQIGKKRLAYSLNPDEDKVGVDDLILHLISRISIKI